MKKLLVASLLGGTLLLTACGNGEGPKAKEDKKEQVDKKQTDKKEESKKEESKKEDKQEAKASDTQSNETAQSVQEPVQPQETTPAEEQPATNEQDRKAEYDAAMEKQMEAGVVPGEGYMNTDEMPNGDAMFDMPGSDGGYYSNDQLDPETGLPKDDAVPHEAGEGPTDEEVADGEMEALREKYDGGLSSGEIQTKNAIEQGYYDGPNEDEVLQEIENEERKIADGYYE